MEISLENLHQWCLQWRHYSKSCESMRTWLQVTDTPCHSKGYGSTCCRSTRNPATGGKLTIVKEEGLLQYVRGHLLIDRSKDKRQNLLFTSATSLSDMYLTVSTRYDIRREKFRTTSSYHQQKECRPPSLLLSAYTKSWEQIRFKALSQTGVLLPA